MSNTKDRLAEAETDTCAWPITTTSILTDEWFSYDKDGRLTDVYEKTPNSGGYYHTTASYWPNSQLETLGILNSSGGSAIPLQTYGVDGEGRTNAVTAASGQSPASAIAYSPSTTATALAGSLTSVTFGSGDSDSYQYNPSTGRMSQYSFNVNGQSAVGSLTWNANGTLQKLAITDPFNSQDNQTCSNTYDDLARLSGNNCGSVWTQTFSYDAFGNVSKSGSISWLPIYNSPANDNVTSNNQYKSGWNGASYDANGNLLNDTFNTYTWSVYGDLASANGAAITYDALDRMVENANGASQFVYAPNGQHQLANMVGQQLASAFVPLPGGAVAVYHSSGLVQYNHSDWLGSARLFSSPTRTASPAMSYAPFGEGYAGGQAYVQFTGINSWTVADTENQSGSLEDFMFRRYSPVQGRWISPDPAGLGAVNPSNPQSWNRYAYVMNSPLSAVDPLGLADGDYESHKGCTPGATSIVCPFGGQTCNIDGAPAPCNMISGSSGAFAVCPGGGCVFNEHGLFQYQQTSDDGGTWVRLNITSVDGGDSGAANIGTIRAGTLDQLNDYCSARGRAKFVADWLPGGGTLARNLWNSSTGAALGFYQLPTADINRITEENSGGQTVAMHATSEGLNAAAGSTALLYAMRAQTGVPMTVGSKMLSGAATVLLVIDAGIGYVKEGQEILNCQAGN